MAYKKGTRKRSNEPVDGYICTKCGKVYEKRDGFFPKTNCPIYEGNDKFMTVCHDCVVEMYDKKVQQFGNELDAAKDICRIFYLYWNPAAFAATKTGNVMVSRMKSYFSKICMIQYNKGTCWDDYVKQDNTVEDIAIVEAQIKTEESEDTPIKVKKTSKPEQVKKWGNAFTADEHNHLDQHYELISSLVENPKEQDPIIKTLCETYVLKSRATKLGDIDDFKKLSELYSAYYKQLERKEEKDSKDYADIPLGVMASIVEGHCPAEYYKDKQLFKDYLGIEDYFNRMVIRPLRNLLTGSRDKDDEYVIDNES